MFSNDAIGADKYYAGKREREKLTSSSFVGRMVSEYFMHVNAILISLVSTVIY